MRKIALLAAGVAVIVTLAVLLSLRFLGSDEGAYAEAPLVMGIDPETTGNTCGPSPADCTLGTVESCVRVDVATPSFDGTSDYVIDVYIDDPAGSAPAARGYDAWVYYDQNIVHIAAPGTDGKIRMPGADFPAGDEFALPDTDGRFVGGWMFLVGTPQPGVDTYIGDGPLLRLGLDIGGSGLVIFSLHEAGSSYASVGPTPHPLSFQTAQLAINEDCPRAPPAEPSPTPVEPEPGVCPPPYRRASTVGDVVGRWQLEGGTVHRDGYVSLHLPAGRHFAVDSGWHSEGLQITIYDLEAQSALNVRGDGCENGRTVPDAAADAVFDEIMATLEIADSYACPSPGRVTPEDFPGIDKAPAVSQIGGQPAKGGAPLRVGDLTLQLPAGRQFRLGGGVSSPGGSFLWLYDVEAQSYLYLRPDGCETSRFIRDAAVDPVFDQIAATVQVTWR